MDVFILFILFLFIVLFAVVAVVVAAVVMSKNRKAFDNQEEKYVRAEVIKTDTNIRRMSTAGRQYSYDHTQYFIELKDDFNNIIVVTCNKKTFETLLPGFYGDVVYKGSKLISFIRLIDHEERRLERKIEEGYFFEKKTMKSNPIDFYCDAPSLGIKIPSDDPIKLDDDEVIKYINRMMENKEENFFGLDNHIQVIQFFHEGDGDQILIDIPDMTRNGSYQAIIYGINKVKSIVRAYYHQEDVFALADFEFMQF